MIRGIFLAVLVLVMLGLSVALYRQYNILPGGEAPPQEQAVLDSGRIMRSWTPPPGADNAATPSDSSTQDSSAQPDAPAAADSPDSAVPETATETPPAPETARQTAQAKPSPDSLLGRPELTPRAKTSTVPDPESDPRAAEEQSQAEQALEKGKDALTRGGTLPQRAVSEVERILEQERRVVEEQQLKQRDVTQPRPRVGALVKQLEDKALNVEPQAPPPPKAEPKPEPKSEVLATVTAKPTPGKKPAGNVLKSLELSSDGNAVFLHVTTEKPLERYATFQVKQPGRVVLDLQGHYAGSVPYKAVRPNALVKDLRTGLHSDKLRVVADLHDDVQAELQLQKRSDTELVLILRQVR